jgi:hypothetical protein
MLFAVHSEFRPTQNPPKYVPRIYGFRLHSSAVEVQRVRRDEEREREKLQKK